MKIFGNEVTSSEMLEWLYRGVGIFADGADAIERYAIESGDDSSQQIAELRKLSESLKALIDADEFGELEERLSQISFKLVMHGKWCQDPNCPAMRLGVIAGHTAMLSRHYTAKMREERAGAN